jgi:tRNA pseudouridine38-40 synthase
MPDCLNRFLPPDIRAVDGFYAGEDFDSNRTAKRKTYCYKLYVSDREMPLKERYATRIERASELPILRQTAKLFEGEHDFKAFCASGSAVKTTVRTVYEVRVDESESFGCRDIKIYVTGNGFLYNMVRIIAGTLIGVGSGKLEPGAFRRAIESQSRLDLGITAPAHGLTLMEVFYTDRRGEE